MDYFKKILVTCALPYANGPIHIGHLFEHIQADIWVRYQRMRGHQVWFICADDAHGTPILLNSQKKSLKPEEMIQIICKEHQIDLKGFNIIYDNYHTTHSNENHQMVIFIYKKLYKQGLITKKNLTQFFDPKMGIFLPDRFVKGVCPICKSNEQYGDHCDVCGSIYKTTDLIMAKSVISGVTPILKKSEHLFFNLPLFHHSLKKWMFSGALPEEIINKLQEWFVIGLKEWNISRDAPYFGFKIPETIDKYFYVWFDAPIGYISTFKNLCHKRNDICFDDFWKSDSLVELCHFIGKDIIYFHSLFWPAILEASGFRKPNHIFVHGYVTVNGQKMSKSRGTFIKASTWLQYLDSDSLRYYYATKISSRIDDIDLNLQELIQRVNSDIVNKIVNLASRTSKFIHRDFSGWLSNKIRDPIIYNRFTESSVTIGNLLSNRDYSHAIRYIMKLADIANSYIHENEPWKITKNKEDLQLICTMGINFFKILMTYIKPVMPSLTQRTEIFLNHILEWNTIAKPLLNHKISEFQFLFNRINQDKINSLISKK